MPMVPETGLVEPKLGVAEEHQGATSETAAPLVAIGRSCDQQRAARHSSERTGLACLSTGHGQGQQLVVTAPRRMSQLE